VIGFFTDPYPDELLYSACARFSDRARYPNAARAVKRLFGRWGGAAVVDLPARIDHLLSALPLNHNYTVDRLINQNTLAPFYAPFLPPEQAHLLKKDMKERQGFNRTKGRIGATTSEIKTPVWLRFCPVCACEDRERFGESYWHRVHQRG
jgi:TniQ